MDVTAGTRIADRYVIDRALAKGGMGAVFVARDERMGARVALKITAAGGAAADELALRFAREARIGHRLGSRRQGFVRASDWGRIDAVQLYLVMDLVDKATPLDLRHGSLEERVARWRRAAELVQVAHEQGVIHRDLKPANFLQAPDGSIFLTDFGLAKVVDEGNDEDAGEHVSLTMTGVGFGTPPYMPPEQLEDAKHADQRADVYALGCMLFEAAALRLPYPGPTANSVMGAHLKVRAGMLPAPRPRDVDPTVPAALDEACVNALELELERRAPSVAILLAALDGAAPTRFEPAPPPPVLTIGGAPTTPPTPARRAEPVSTPTPSSLPTGAGVPTNAPRSLEPAPPTPAPRTAAGPRRALAVGVALLAVLAGAFAADVGGARRRLGASDEPPDVPDTERPPRTSTTPTTPTETLADTPTPPAPTPTRPAAQGPAWLSRVPADRRPATLPPGVAYGEGQGEYRNEKDGSVLVWIPPGSFRMGSDAGGSDEKPVHEVRLTRGYFLGKHEVTWAQYRRFCQATSRTAPTNVIDYQGRFEAGEQHPVFNVSWDDAQAYLQWAGLRLPTEAEWEYAARGSDGRTYPWGNEEPGTSRCNLNGTGDGHAKTAPVGSFASGASPFGALDMAGNVWEWVQDWYADSYPAGTQANPSGPATGISRARRGGSWGNDSGLCRAAFRNTNSPGNRNYFLGFRPARSAEDR